MKNWSVDVSKMNKKSDEYKAWRLSQLINFGLDGVKLAKKDLIKYWSKLVIDSKKKNYLEHILWPVSRS